MIATAVCDSYKAEVLQGIHQPGDDYRLALYSAGASLGQGTTLYSPAGEVSGTGYVAGGVSLGGFSVVLASHVAMLDFSPNPLWPSSTITARGALVYNATRGNRAVATYDFGHDVTSTDGPFTVALPAATPSTALVQVA